LGTKHSTMCMFAQNKGLI